jgi:hypothetical protein
VCVCVQAYFNIRPLIWYTRWLVAMGCTSLVLLHLFCRHSTCPLKQTNYANCELCFFFILFYPFLHYVKIFSLVPSSERTLWYINFILFLSHFIVFFYFLLLCYSCVWWLFMSFCSHFRDFSFVSPFIMRFLLNLFVLLCFMLISCFPISLSLPLTYSSISSSAAVACTDDWL